MDERGRRTKIYLFLSGLFDGFLHLFERFSSLRVDPIVNLNEIIHCLIENRRSPVTAADRRTITPRHFTRPKLFERFTHVVINTFIQLEDAESFSSIVSPIDTHEIFICFPQIGQDLATISDVTNTIVAIRNIVAPKQSPPKPLQRDSFEVTSLTWVRR